MKLQTAEDCFNYACDNLTSTKKDSTACRRIFRFESEIDRTRDRYFQPIKNNRDVHQIMSTEAGILTVRKISCYTCEKCLGELYEDCVQNMGTETRIIQTEKSKKASEEPEEETEPSLMDMIKKDSIIAVYTDDPGEDYYLIKATHEPVVLTQDEADSWGNYFKRNMEVVRGFYYRKLKSSLTFKLISNKQVLISVKSILCPLEISPNKSITLPVTMHEDLISMAAECT